DPTAWSATWPATIPISSAKQPISSVCICILHNVQPWSDETINAQIVTEVLRIQTAFLEWSAKPEEGSFDDKITETLVGTLDAHAKALLTALNRETEMPAYGNHLRRIVAILLPTAIT